MAEPARAPELTVFTASVYPDLARIWLACLRRSLPAGTARFELFQDREEPFDPEHFPGVALLARGPRRRDFHDAYNDAVRRAETPLLAFVDSDNFWLSEELWPLARRLLDDPKTGPGIAAGTGPGIAAGTAAVSLVSRHETESHGTFSVVLRAAVYRELLAGLPEGFFPAWEPAAASAAPGADPPEPGGPPPGWRHRDTGDRICRAALAAGWRIPLLRRDLAGEIVRFRGITLTRRTAGWLGLSGLRRMIGCSRYFFRGVTGNLLLRRLHDRLFPAGPAYDFPYPAAALIGRGLWRGLTAGGPAELGYRLRYLLAALRAERRVARYLAGNRGAVPGPGAPRAAAGW